MFSHRRRSEWIKGKPCYFDSSVQSRGASRHKALEIHVDSIGRLNLVNRPGLVNLSGLWLLAAEAARAGLIGIGSLLANET